MGMIVNTLSIMISDNRMLRGFLSMRMISPTELLYILLVNIPI